MGSHTRAPNPNPIPTITAASPQRKGSTTGLARGGGDWLRNVPIVDDHWEVPQDRRAVVEASVFVDTTGELDEESVIRDDSDERVEQTFVVPPGIIVRQQLGGFDGKGGEYIQRRMGSGDFTIEGWLRSVG